MKKLLLSALVASAALTAAADVTFPIVDYITFYDGWRTRNIPEDAPDEGMTRLYCSLATKSLPDEVLDALGDKLIVDLTHHAHCDNYDRIAGLFLAFIPKGQESYDVNHNDTDPIRIELARYISPFLNRNIDPQDSPYRWDVSYLTPVLRSRQIRETYDIWIECSFFGAPYDAWNKVAGCADCQDVGAQTVTWTTDDTPGGLLDDVVFVPIAVRGPDWADDGLNNYQEGDTDEIGRCIKTWSVDVPEECREVTYVLTMSNHGANSGGEEYNRRWHYIYGDGVELGNFRPGRDTCEPFRVYNTQANGIYGTRPQTDAQWQSFSNWCPGDVIDNRLFPVDGGLKAGTHTFCVEVPDARFRGGQGYFPTSVFMIGRKGESTNAIQSITTGTDAGTDGITIDIAEGALTVTSPTGQEPTLVELYDTAGRLVRYAPAATMSTQSLERGMYIVVATVAGRQPEAVRVAL